MKDPRPAGRNPYLIVIGSWLGFTVLFWFMDFADPKWGPNDLWLHLFFAPVKPIELLFKPFLNFLIAHQRALGGKDFYPCWFFGMFCYTLAGTFYPALWTTLRGRGTRWSMAPFALTAILFAAQLILGYGWEEYEEPA